MSASDKKLGGRSRKEAKRLKKEFDAGQQLARDRVTHVLHKEFPNGKLSLQNAQHVVAVEQGYLNWNALLNTLREKAAQS